MRVGSMSVFNQVEEFVAGFFGFEKGSAESRCGGDGVGFLDSPDLHAGVGGLNDHCNAEWIEGFLNAVSDFYREPFLDL